jgi:hypothetical protein
MIFLRSFSMGTAYFFTLTAFLMISSCFTGNYIMEQGWGDPADGLKIILVSCQ